MVLQMLGRDRFDQVIGAVLTQGLDRAVDRGVAGEDHRFRQLGQRAQLAYNLGTVHVRQTQIHQRDRGRRRRAAGEFETLATAGGRQRRVAAMPQDVAQRAQELIVVVDDEDRQQISRG